MYMISNDMRTGDDASCIANIGEKIIAERFIFFYYYSNTHYYYYYYLKISVSV